MPAVSRVLDPAPIESLEGYIDIGGGGALEAARAAGADATITTVLDAGLRGRGGAGFPTGRKWQTVAQNRSDLIPTTVVVNAAEGEPGSFKDRALVRRNPYRILEGALIAAAAVSADRVVVGARSSFSHEIERLARAIKEVEAAGWAGRVNLVMLAGPEEYLFGEETALLEVVGGRHPFPRIAPPYRRGVDENWSYDEADSGAWPADRIDEHMSVGPVSRAAGRSH